MSTGEPQKIVRMSDIRVGSVDIVDAPANEKLFVVVKRKNTEEAMQEVKKSEGGEATAKTAANVVKAFVDALKELAPEELEKAIKECGEEMKKFAPADNADASPAGEAAKAADTVSKGLNTKRLGKARAKMFVDAMKALVSFGKAVDEDMLKAIAEDNGEEPPAASPDAKKEEAAKETVKAIGDAVTKSLGTMPAQVTDLVARIDRLERGGVVSKSLTGDTPPADGKVEKGKGDLFSGVFISNAK